MTNPEKVQLIQQHSEPNHDRIRDLQSEGYSRQEAEEIDSLERREAVLNELGAAGDLTADQRDELDNVQSHLHELVGSPQATYVGTSFSGDGAPADPDLDVEDKQEVTEACVGALLSLANLAITIQDAHGRDSYEANQVLGIMRRLDVDDAAAEAWEQARDRSEPLPKASTVRDLVAEHYESTNGTADDDWMSVESVNEMQSGRQTQMIQAVRFLNRYEHTGNDASLRIAIRHAQKAKELEDRIDAALLAAIKRETVPAP